MTSPTSFLVLQFFPTRSSCNPKLKFKSLKPFSVNSVSRKTGSCWSPHFLTRWPTKVSFAFKDGDGDGEGDGDEVGVSDFKQEPLLASADSFAVEATLNRLSKWVIMGVLCGVLVWRHDALALWFSWGSVWNLITSVTLKQILNQERPVSHLRSDPGMPSSHAQNFFFISTFAVLSLLEVVGINGFTILSSAVTMAIASYLTWLRVSQQLHTVSQIGVGAVLGTAFSISWYWGWHALVMEAFKSLFWVRLLVTLGPPMFCLTFLLSVCPNWLKDQP